MRVKSVVNKILFDLPFKFGLLDFISLLLDPNSGTINSILVNYGVIEKPINLLGQKYLIFNILGFELKLRLALTTVIFFEIWRYFPLAFLFILARLQAIPKDLYEAADVDGAGPFRKFFYITLPQITAILSLSLIHI